MNNQEINSYNDGILYFLVPKDNKNQFGAKINIKNIKDLKRIGSSYFKEETRRIQDYQFAEGLNHKLTFKVKIPYKKGIKSNLKILIDGYLYDLIHFDNDKRKSSIYLYLEGIGFCE